MVSPLMVPASLLAEVFICLGQPITRNQNKQKPLQFIHLHSLLCILFLVHYVQNYLIMSLILESSRPRLLYLTQHQCLTKLTLYTPHSIYTCLLNYPRDYQVAHTCNAITWEAGGAGVHSLLWQPAQFNISITKQTKAKQLAFDFSVANECLFLFSSGPHPLYTVF